MTEVSYPNADYDPQVHAERVRRWQAEDSDERLRTNYSCLGPDSVILDLGGFNGDFSFRMNSQYGATCHVFELNPEWCEYIQADSRCNEKIIVHSFGLAGSTRQEKLFLVAEGSSTFLDRSQDAKTIDAKLIRALDWFNAELGNAVVDLAKINIEGGEYELLEHLIETGITRRIKNIQVQFHEDVIPDAIARMNSIHEKLAVTHRVTFQEKFVWENWELIDNCFNKSDDILTPDTWDDSDYLARYPDVAQAVALKQFTSGWQHYVQHGGGEGRLPGGAFATAPSVTRDCLDPWRYLEITPTHGVKPCCNIPTIAEWMPNGVSLGDLRNGEAFQLLRRQLLTGWLSEACRRCHIRPFVPLNEFQATVQRECASATGETGMMAHPLRELRVEVTTKCNLRCVYCAVSQPGYSAAEMAKTTFDEIIALVSVQSRDLDIVLNGHGETTFHRDWLHLCKAIVDLGFRPSIITNLARPLSDEEASCLAGFRIVCISLDMVNAELLRNLRRRVKLSNILDNIHKIRAAAKAKRLRLPAINISCCVYNENYMHLVEFAKFCIMQGIYGVTFWQLVKYDDVPGVQNVYPITSLDNDKIAEAIYYVERTIKLLHQNGVKTDTAGGFLDEWRKQITQSRDA